MVSFFFGTFSIFIAFVTFANSQRHYLLNTLNATSELGWAVYSSLNNDGVSSILFMIFSNVTFTLITFLF